MFQVSAHLPEEGPGSVLKEQPLDFLYDFCSACSKSIMRDGLLIKPV